jgi:hypothetical protein
MTSRATIAVLAVVIAVATHSAPAIAGERDEAKAAEHFALAEQAEARGDWQTAILEYKRAYALKPHPSVLFNIANNYEKLGDWSNAADYLGKYLEASPDAEDRAEVEQRIATLRARAASARGGGAAQGSGVLVVRANVDGATVKLDGTPIGKTPLTLAVSAGHHVLELEMPGHAPARREIDVTPGGSEEVREFLAPTGDGGGDGGEPRRASWGIGYGIGGGLGDGAGIHYQFLIGVRMPSGWWELDAFFGTLGRNDTGVGASMRFLLSRSAFKPYLRVAGTLGNATFGLDEYRTYGGEAGGGIIYSYGYGQKVGTTPAARRLAIEIYGEVDARFTAGGVGEEMDGMPVDEQYQTKPFFLVVNVLWQIRF